MTRPTDLTTTASTTGTAPRLWYLDNLRVLLTVLVVLFHVALTYGNLPIWYYHEPAGDPSGVALDLFVVVVQMFFMGGFFLISGYFAPGSYDRRGGRRFVRNRLLRLGVPLLVYLLVLRPMVNFGGLAMMRATYDPALPYWRYYLLSWDPGPLWFVEVLLAFALVYALLRRLRGPVAPADEPARAPGTPAIAAFVAVLGLATFAWRLLVPNGTYWPIVGLPSPAYLPQYVLLFAVGAMAYRRGWLTAMPRRAGALGLVAAGVALVALAVAGFAPGQAAGTSLLLMAAFAEAVFATGILVGLLMLFRERWNRQGASGRFLAAHAYAVYIVHPLVLVALGYAFAWLDAPAAVKFLLVGTLAVPLCWLAAALVRSLPRADRVL
jgi:peptidoglycan/LPS O-acetylase OafA/YrhL